MEINSTTLYLFTLCDSAHELLLELQGFSIFLGIIMTLIVLVQKLTNPNNPPRTLTKLLLFFFIPFLFCTSCVRVFLPSTREMAAIVVIPKVLKNEPLNDTLKELYTLSVEWMKSLNAQKKERD